MAQKTILDLLIQELRDTYSSETQIEQGLGRMAQAATSPNLKKAFTTHREETRVQIERLDQVFQHLKASPQGNDCEATQGLIAEAEEVIGAGLPNELLDVALIMAAQKVEHYEIASYGSLLAIAEGCGLTEIAALLEKTLDEEEETDEKLTELAESEVNERAFEAARNAA
jgi:ferritin-like metal-binding protein YciE